MSNNYVQVAPNSTGVKLQTFENTVGSNVVDAEAVAIVDTTGASILGTAGTPNADVLTVQGISGGTSLPVTVGAGTSVIGVTGVAQGSTTAGENGDLVQGAVTTGSPSYTTAQTSPLSLTTAGALRVDASATTQPISGTVSQGTAAANTAGWPVTNGGTAEATASWTSATTVNTALQMNTAGYGSVVVTLNQGTTLTGGTVTFEASDTTAFTNAYLIFAMIQGNSSSPFITAVNFNASTNSSYLINTGGYAAIRVRLSTVISGTGTVNVGMTGTTSVVIPFIPETIIGRSILGAVTPSDNATSTSVFPNTGGAGASLAVSDTIYGGAFSGTANGALSGWSKRRAPTVFKTVQATASGNTAVWTPGSGNKFRLLKVFVELTDNASITSGGVVTISFQDGSTAMPIAFDVFVPSAAVTTVIGDGLEQELDLGDFGILSATANNVLNVNLSTVLATGNVRVVAMGTEE